MRVSSPVKKIVGGFEVSTTKLRAIAALKLAPKITKILLPALRFRGGISLVLQALRNPGSEMADADAASVGSALITVFTELVTTLDDATLDMLCRELLVDTSIAVPDDKGVLTIVELNSPTMIDMAFSGLDNGLTLLVETMLFVGEVNFKTHFFDLLGRAGLKRKAPAPTTPVVVPE